MNGPFTAPALGHHILVDFWGADHLHDPRPAADVLRRAAQSAGATVLEVNLHDFGDRAGFTGVALLAESHISIHTWPEHGYAAIDIFMCGDCDPLLSLAPLRAYFQPESEQIKQLKRGLAPAVT
ncbi:MAG: adenosylmethionine decarboxylase [Pelagimonas sp.]|uniref:adenosylmethionine decarboxylase n=1 Tax=Pelagimonas sp. TaxID=2073170 RepID=UPI003D6A1415